MLPSCNDQLWSYQLCKNQVTVTVLRLRTHANDERTPPASRQYQHFLRTMHLVCLSAWNSSGTHCQFACYWKRRY